MKKIIAVAALMLGFAASAPAAMQGITDIAADPGHTCALVNGAPRCWGDNFWLELGSHAGARAWPVPAGIPALPSGVTSIALGGQHSCALTTAGGVKCWGRRDKGYMTIGDALPVQDIPGLGSGVIAIAAGGIQSCALMQGGGVKCWGNDFTWNPADVPGLASGVAAIDVGGLHACAILAGGALVCWGDNSYGQLGDGTTTNRSTPVAVLGLGAGVTSVSAGNAHTCAVLSTGTAKCWGFNNQGQLGEGSTTDADAPVDVVGLGGVAQIAAGGNTCARTASGAVWCWGGQLGDGTTNTSSIPQLVNLGAPAQAITTGSASCAVTVDGEAKCWGGNQGGEIGDGTLGNPVLTPTLVGGPPRLVNISTRGHVLTGNDVMIAGFVIGPGDGVKTVVIAATGPSLANFGIDNPLSNPTMVLVRSSDNAIMATNDDWTNAPWTGILPSTGFAPSNPNEAAIWAQLAPGAYTAIVSGVNGGTGTSVAAVYEVDRPEMPLANISTRGRVQTGNDVMIGGFVIEGYDPQTVTIVATGPSLAAFGIDQPLANPQLKLVRSSDQAVLATNDNWQDAANSADVQASGYAPSNPLESAIRITLPPGAYTAIVSGVGGGEGIGVVAVYPSP